MAAAMGFRQFDAEVEEWELYKEQLDQFFVSNKVKEGEEQRSALINHLSAKTYKLLRDICTPVQPKDKSYDDLCKLLSAHFTPPMIVHRERRTFFRARRNENGPESVNDWIVRIKNLAANCKFGDCLKHNLVNKFVDGLDGKAYDRVCEEDEKLTLEKAQEIALKYEIDSTPQTLEHHYVKGRSNATAGGRKKQQEPSKPRGDIRCRACNKSGHIWRDCRYKGFVCRKCNVKGHLEAACEFQRANYLADNAEHNEDHANTPDDRIDLQQNYLSKSICATVFALRGTGAVEQPIKLDISVDKEPLAMELDSGAGISVISDEFYKLKFPRWKLQHTDIRLMGYNGKSLEVQGTICPVVAYGGQSQPLMFVVVKGEDQRY